jgi:hypothetical protein
LIGAIAATIPQGTVDWDNGKVANFCQILLVFVNFVKLGLSELIIAHAGIGETSFGVVDEAG